jgi:tetratricopeptide (TPR) repeat protein
MLCLFGIVPAFAESDWLLAQTDKPQYHTGEDLEITGFIMDATAPQIAVRIYDPDGEILGAYGVEVELDDTFSKTISLDSPFYDKSGLYLIEFDYGSETDDLIFEIIGTAKEESKPVPLAPEVLMVMTDKTTYSDNEFITISGLVSDIGDPTILIGVFDPDDYPAGFYTPPVNTELEFSVSFLAKSGVNFKKTGAYTIKAHYGQSKETATFSFANSPTSNNAPITPPPQIILNPTPTQTTTSAPIPTHTAKQIIPKIEDPIPKPVQQDIPQVESDNSEELAREEKEIGQLLNQINRECDNSQYTDSITYGDGMGPALMRLCNYEQAVSYFDRALLKDPNNPEILTNKGSALGKLGKFDLALEHYNLALKLDPKFIPALNNKANALAEMGELEEAITLYHRILDEDPTYGMANANLQKANEEIIKYAKMQVGQESVSVNLDDSIPKTESAKINYESPKPKNVMEQIGSFFAGIFGFLK